MHPQPAFANPFRSSIVADPWQPDVIDVPEIHAEAFRACCDALAFVRRERRSTSVLLYGNAGSGKTHLLARLQRRLVGQRPELEVSAAEPDSIFISVRLQTSPQMIWRHLRRRLSEDLLRPFDDGSTQLERMLLRRLTEFRPGITDPHDWLERIRQQQTAAARGEAENFVAFLEQWSQFNHSGLAAALGWLLRGEQRSQAGAWLRGDSLPEGVLNRLGIGAADEDDPEYEAQRLVLALTRLAGPQTPLVFCFDQVEALQVQTQDDRGLSAFGQMLSALHDQTDNALLISCVLITFLHTLDDDRFIIKSDRKRISEFTQRALDPLNPDEARRLIVARLDSVPELKERRAGRHDLWPLSEEHLREAMETMRWTPRELLAFCAEKFDEWRGPVDLPARRPLPQFLAETWDERLARARTDNTTQRTDEIVGHALPLLVSLREPRLQHQSESRLRDVEMFFKGAGNGFGVSLCNHQGYSVNRGLPSKLSRLCGLLDAGKLTRLVIIRDARLPIGKAAHVTRQHRDALSQQGVRWVTPTEEALAALDALRSLLSDAESGDLANDGETVRPQTLRDWLIANFPASLTELADAVLFETADDPALNLREDLLALLAERHVIALTDAAEALKQPAAALAACVERHAAEFGWMSGPPAALFELTPEFIETQ